MKRRALRTLLRVRHLAVVEAQKGLAGALAAEAAAEAVERSATDRVQSELEAASSTETGDSAVEAFAAWLPLGRQALERARETHTRAEVEVTRARAALAASRSAEAVIERAIEVEAEEQIRQVARREQAALDEAGRRK